jgi:signal peptidase I
LRRAVWIGFKGRVPPADAHVMDHIAATPAPLPLGRPIRRRFGWHLAAAAVLAVAGAWLMMHKQVTQYTVTSGSMEPTLRVGERVGAESHGGVKIGDIVVFHPPAGARPANPVCGAITEGTGSTQPCGLPVAQESRSVFVKRVVAGPGDEISIVDGHVIRNGERQAEPYVATCGADGECNFPKPVRVPPGEYYLLGDNRGVSDDSRFWGPVPSAWIIGTVVRCSLLNTTCRPMH